MSSPSMPFFSIPNLSKVHMTAFGAAAMRARHLLADGYPKILEDHFAQQLLGMDTEQLVISTSQYVANPKEVSFWVLRSRFAEDRLAAARARNVRQYVILGAGLDSFALRDTESHDGLVTYEVDDPPLQQWKRQRFEELQIATPTNLRFAACDFETTSLAQALEAVAFDTKAPAVVSFLGVTQYISREAIMETLRWVASLATESEVVLTYITPNDTAETTKGGMAAHGIRYETFFTPDEISALLGQAGLVGIEHLTPEGAQRRYFEGRTDGLVAPEVARLVIGKAP